VGLANAAATGLGHKKVGVGVGVIVGVPVGEAVKVGKGVLVVVGVGVVVELAVGRGVGVMLGVALGGRGVCVMNGSRAATCGGTTV
jgi:hypothetical protein